MPDYKYFEIPDINTWVIQAPKRSHRPQIKIHKGKGCPFCPENGKHEEEVFRIGGHDHDDKWQVRVLKNKYPFASIQEIVVLTHHHDRRFEDLTVDQARFALEAFINRYNEYRKKGSVCIFVNSGIEAGESISHAHAQIVVVPDTIKVVVPKLEKKLSHYDEYLQVGHYNLICPSYSQWPDEVWIIPKERNRYFGDIRYEEVETLAYVLKRIIKIFALRHGNRFPYNYYIYPGKDWYLRIMPRAKIPGGFEISTGIFINTQDPKETIQFIKKHFYEGEEKKIKREKAKYRRGV